MEDIEARGWRTWKLEWRTLKLEDGEHGSWKMEDIEAGIWRPLKLEYEGHGSGSGGL